MVFGSSVRRFQQLALASLNARALKFSSVLQLPVSSIESGWPLFSDSVEFGINLKEQQKTYINDDENNSGLIDSGAMDGQYFRPRSASFLHYIQHSRTGPRSVSSISQMYPILPRVASPAKPALQFTKWGDGGVLSLLFSSCHTQ